MIELYLLEQLDAFHRCGTLSAAAEELHLSQPSLSRSMQKLEDTLGVPLFERQKNRLALNSTGILAAEDAGRILSSVAAMEERIRLHDRSLHTLTVGSCAPGPLMRLLPLVTGAFSDLSVSSGQDTADHLLQGLRDGAYQLIVLPRPVEEEGLVCRPYLTEHLYMSITPFHPAAPYKTISFAQADGQNFIMYAKVGIWEDIVREKMPHAHFFKQEDQAAVEQLGQQSDLPLFSTNITIETIPARRKNRLNIPFSDPEAKIAFHLVYRKADEKRFRRFLSLL